MVDLHTPITCQSHFVSTYEVVRIGEHSQRDTEREREEKRLRKIQDLQQELDSNGGHGKARRGRRFYSGGGAVHRTEVWSADETHQDVVAGGSSGESQISAQIECPCSSSNSNSSYAADTQLQQLHHQVCPAAPQLEAARLNNGKESPDMVRTRNTHINSSIDLHCNDLWK